MSINAPDFTVSKNVSSSVGKSVSATIASAEKSVSSAIAGIEQSIKGQVSSATSKLLDIGNGLSNSLSSSLKGIDTKSLSSSLSGSQSILKDLTNSSTISKVLPVSSMPNVLAKPTFSAGANDALASVDVYATKASGGTINSIQALTDTASLPKLDGFGSAAASAGNLKSIISKSTAAVNSIAKFNPLSTLQSQVPTMFSSLRTLPPHCGGSLSDSILGELTGIKGYGGTMGGVGFNATSSCAIGMAETINAMAAANGCNNTPFALTDPSAKLAALSNLMQHALGLGLPNVFGSIICGLSDLLSIDKLASKVGMSTALATDLFSLGAIANSTTPGAVVKTNPTIINNFTINYNGNAPGIQTNGATKNYDALMTSYNKLDPNWMKTSTKGNGNITDLSKVVKASPDFNKTVGIGITNKSVELAKMSHSRQIDILSSDGVDNQDLLLVPELATTTVNVRDALKNHFPKVPLNKQLRSNKYVYDPVTLSKSNSLNSNKVASVNTQPIFTKTNEWVDTGNGIKTLVVTTKTLVNGIYESRRESINVGANGVVIH